MMKPSRVSSPRLLLAGLAALLAGCGGGSGGGGGNPLPTKPEITTQPQSVTTVQGQSVTLSVVARAQGQLFYTWYRVGNDGSLTSTGVRTATFTIPSVSTSDVGLYRVLVENINNEQTYSDVVAVLFDGSPPVITTQPTAKSAIPGDAIALTVSAAGAPPPTYQWTKDGGAIPGATNPVYRIASASQANVGSYTVTITNRNGSVTSAAVAVTLTTITSQPQPQEVNEGASVTFSVTATGAGLFYQWYRNDTPISRATSPTLTFNASAASPGTYFVRISTGSGNLDSNGARLIVHLLPTITTEPTPGIQRVNSGQTVTYSVVAQGEGTLTYQWYFVSDATGATTAVSGATSPTLSFAASKAGEGQYYVVVTNAVGSKTSTLVHLTVN